MPSDMDAPTPPVRLPPCLPGDQVTCIVHGAPGAPIPGAIYIVASVHEDDRAQWSLRLHPRTLGDAPSGLWPAINFIRNTTPGVARAGFINGPMDDETVPSVAATLARRAALEPLLSPEQESDIANHPAPVVDPTGGVPGSTAPHYSALSPHQERAVVDIGRGFQSPHMPMGVYRPDLAAGTPRPITPAEPDRERAPWEHPAPLVHDRAQAPASKPITLHQLVSDAVRESLEGGRLTQNRAAEGKATGPRPACLTCAHARPAGALDTWRRCHGAPPHPNDNEYAVWPLVRTTDSCAAWRLKPTDNPPTTGGRQP